MCRLQINQYRQELPGRKPDIVAGFRVDTAFEFHRLLPGYKPTPLVRLPGLAEQLGLREIYVKDEAHRFGLKAFKVLGASYAIFRFLRQQWGGNRGRPFELYDFFNDKPYRRLKGFFTFCTATDGNHGRGVAWTARRMSQKAVIYMPGGTVAARIKNIQAEKARVIVVDGTYDEAVRQAAEDAQKHDWIVISDTAYEGYAEIPGYIMSGYITMFYEMENTLHQLDDPGVDFVILQGGVGSFAAAAVRYYVNRYGRKRPALICVEPTEAACLYDSITSEGGNIAFARGNFRTMMAGLNCGTPSLIAWPILKTGVDAFMTIADSYAADAMRRYYFPSANDPSIESGESGAAGLGGLLALMKNPRLEMAKQAIGISKNSRVLLINTEGATDPENFKKIVGG